MRLIRLLRRGRLGFRLCVHRDAGQRGASCDADSPSYAHAASAQGARLREKSLKQEAGGDASDYSDDDDDESDIAEELGYISPLDTVDPYVTFKQALTGELPMAALEGEAYSCFQ